MAEPNLDLGLEYTGGINKPTTDQAGKYARVVVDPYGDPNLEYVTLDIPEPDSGITYGANLTNADQTLTVATGNDGSKLIIPLTAPRTKTLSTTGAVNGAMRTIENHAGGVTYALTVANGGIEGGTLVVANMRWARFKFGMGQWGFDAEGAL